MNKIYMRLNADISTRVPLHVSSPFGGNMNVLYRCTIRFRGQQGWQSLVAISKELWHKHQRKAVCFAKQ